MEVTCLNLVLIRIWKKYYNNDNRRLSTHLLTYILTLIIKELKISVEQGRVVTTLNIIFSVVCGAERSSLWQLSLGLESHLWPVLIQYLFYAIAMGIWYHDHQETLWLWKLAASESWFKDLRL